MCSRTVAHAPPAKRTCAVQRIERLEQALLLPVQHCSRQAGSNSTDEAAQIRKGPQQASQSATTAVQAARLHLEHQPTVVIGQHAHVDAGGRDGGRIACGRGWQHTRVLQGMPGVWPALPAKLQFAM